MELPYRRVGDYLLPYVGVSDPLDALPLGRYGRMHKEYLREYRPIMYSRLLLSERLYPLCREIDEAAEHRHRMIGNHEIAHEAILNELVYT